jgi:hypothetical protein
LKRLSCVGLAILLAGCGSSGPTCTAPSPGVPLIEGYCTMNEADRCYLDHNLADGF